MIYTAQPRRYVAFGLFRAILADQAQSNRQLSTTWESQRVETVLTDHAGRSASAILNTQNHDNLVLAYGRRQPHQDEREILVADITTLA